MLKAFTPVVTMLFAFLFKLEHPSLLLVSAVALITAGVAVASWGEGAFSITGVTSMAGSMVCEALRLVLTQSLVSKRAMHPVQTLAYLAPAATMWMLLLAGLTEALAIHQHQALYDVLKHPTMLLASAAAGFGSNAMAMLVISISGALTLKCLGLAKDVGLVCFGVVMLGEVVSRTQALGYSISLLGFMLYNAAKLLVGHMQQPHSGTSSSASASAGRLKPQKAVRSRGRVRVEACQNEHPANAESCPLICPDTSPAKAGKSPSPSPSPAPAAAAAAPAERVGSSPALSRSGLPPRPQPGVLAGTGRADASGQSVEAAGAPGGARAAAVAPLALDALPAFGASHTGVTPRTPPSTTAVKPAPLTGRAHTPQSPSGSVSPSPQGECTDNQS